MNRPEVAAILETSLHGNHVALDLVNTVDWRLAPERADHVDLLPDDEVLLVWGHRVGLLSDDELEEGLRKLPVGATSAREKTVALREVLYSIFARVAGGEAPEDDDLGRLRDAFTDAVAHATLRSTSEGALGWAFERGDVLDRVRWAVAASAVDLLTTGDLGRVKQCLDSGCGWLFLDLSKNASRRWCSMQGCGARAKMRRQYRRKKEGAGAHQEETAL